MGGKKWCEYCHINIDYNKKAIQDHEATRMHIHNKAKSIKFQRIKIRKQKAQAIAKNPPLLSTANIPKAKKGSQLQNQVRAYRQDVITSGKAAIHKLIAQKTQGLYGAPIEYPEISQLNILENYKTQTKQGKDKKYQNQVESGNEDQFKMWRIQICKQQNKACFVNSITKAKLFQPPVGYIMSEEEQQQWNQAQQDAQYMRQLKEHQKQQAMLPVWEECSSQDYFVANEAKLSEQQYQSPQQKQTYNNKINGVKKEQGAEKQLQWREQLQQKIQNNQIGGQQVIQTVLYNKLKECKNVKQKNQSLKQLIKRGFQIEAIVDNNNQLYHQQAQGIGIKPRKMVKKSKLTFQSDFF